MSFLPVETLRDLTGYYDPHAFHVYGLSTMGLRRDLLRGSTYWVLSGRDCEKKETGERWKNQRKRNDFWITNTTDEGIYTKKRKERTDGARRMNGYVDEKV